MGKTTPTARTLAELRKLGYLAEVVEKRLPRCFITKDLFGLADVLAIKAGEAPLAVQCTSGSNASARVKKALGTPALCVLLAANVVFEVWAWRKSASSRKWVLTRRAITLAQATTAHATTL